MKFRNLLLTALLLITTAAVCGNNHELVAVLSPEDSGKISSLYNKEASLMKELNDTMDAIQMANAEASDKYFKLTPPRRLRVGYSTDYKFIVAYPDGCDLGENYVGQIKHGFLLCDGTNYQVITK